MMENEIEKNNREDWVHTYINIHIHRERERETHTGREGERQQSLRTNVRHTPPPQH